MPTAPCAECLSNAKTTDKFIIIACPHNQAVALMKVKGSEPEGVWRVFTPAKPSDLIELMRSDSKKGGKKHESK